MTMSAHPQSLVPGQHLYEGETLTVGELIALLRTVDPSLALYYASTFLSVPVQGVRVEEGPSPRPLHLVFS